MVKYFITKAYSNEVQPFALYELFICIKLISDQMGLYRST